MAGRNRHFRRAASLVVLAVVATCLSTWAPALVSLVVRLPWVVTVYSTSKNHVPFVTYVNPFVSLKIHGIYPSAQTRIRTVIIPDAPGLGAYAADDRVLIRAGFPLRCAEANVTFDRQSSPFGYGAIHGLALKPKTSDRIRYISAVLPLRVKPELLALNFGAYLSFFGIGGFGVQRLVRARRIRRGQCRSCGYPVSDAARCPECGVPSNSPTIARRAA